VARDQAAGGAVTEQGDLARVQAQSAPPLLAPVAPAQEGQRADVPNNPAAPERAGVVPGPASPQAQVAGAGREPARAGSVGDRSTGEARTAPAQAVDKGDAAARNSAAAAAGEGVPAAKQADARSSRTSGAQEARDAERQREQQRSLEERNPALKALDQQIRDLLPNMWKASRAAVDMMIGEEARKAAEERAQRLQALHERLVEPPLARLAEQAAQNYAATGGSTQPAEPGQQLDRLA
jgi:hypothetical protein